MKKLASIQKVKEIKPIEGNAELELAYVLNRCCLVRKGVFNVGEMAVYFEPESLLPAVPEYEPFRRLMHDFKSDGLLLPIELCFKDCMPIFPLEEGEDVTEMLNVKEFNGSI